MFWVFFWLFCNFLLHALFLLRITTTIRTPIAHYRSPTAAPSRCCRGSSGHRGLHPPFRVPRFMHPYRPVLKYQLKREQMKSLDQYKDYEEFLQEAKTEGLAGSFKDRQALETQFAGEIDIRTMCGRIEKFLKQRG